MRVRRARARIEAKSYNETCDDHLKGVIMSLLEVSKHTDYSGVSTPYQKRGEPKAISRKRLALLILSILMFGASASLLSVVWASTINPESPLEAARAHLGDGDIFPLICYCLSWWIYF